MRMPELSRFPTAYFPGTPENMPGLFTIQMLKLRWKSVALPPLRIRSILPMTVWSIWKVPTILPEQLREDTGRSIWPGIVFSVFISIITKNLIQLILTDMSFVPDSIPPLSVQSAWPLPSGEPLFSQKISIKTISDLMSRKSILLWTVLSQAVSLPTPKLPFKLAMRSIHLPMTMALYRLLFPMFLLHTPYCSMQISQKIMFPKAIHSVLMRSVILTRQ